MADFIISLDADTLKKTVLKIIKESSSEIFKQIFNASTKIIFDNNEICFKILLFKYYIKLEKFPKFFCGEYHFSHNLPINMINYEKIPENIKISKNNFIIIIPENAFSKSFSINQISMVNNILNINLGSNYER